MVNENVFGRCLYRVAEMALDIEPHNTHYERAWQRANAMFKRLDMAPGAGGVLRARMRGVGGFSSGDGDMRGHGMQKHTAAATGQRQGLNQALAAQDEEDGDELDMDMENDAYMDTILDDDVSKIEKVREERGRGGRGGRGGGRGYMPSQSSSGKRYNEEYDNYDNHNKRSKNY